MGGRSGREGIGGLAAPSDGSAPLAWGVRKSAFFPGKKQRSLFFRLEGYNGSLFGLLMGCGGTMSEGGWEVAASLLRRNR